MSNIEIAVAEEQTLKERKNFLKGKIEGLLMTMKPSDVDPDVGNALEEATNELNAINHELNERSKKEIGAIADRYAYYKGMSDAKLKDTYKYLKDFMQFTARRYCICEEAKHMSTLKDIHKNMDSIESVMTERNIDFKEKEEF